MFGIIPAYAGNTMRSPLCCAPLQDHPRVCGEHAFINGRRLPVKGSSPRMRGTLRVYDNFIHANGIIPAYAGNTPDGLTDATALRDHPRVCGEHRDVYELRYDVQGSSPRMRGTRNLAGECDGDIGIIPAYAGNTSSSGSRGFGYRDHPRVCGEH